MRIIKRSGVITKLSVLHSETNRKNSTPNHSIGPTNGEILGLSREEIK